MTETYNLTNAPPAATTKLVKKTAEEGYWFWLQEEVAPKLRMVEEALAKEFMDRRIEAFLASSANGIQPYIYWRKDRQSAFHPPASSKPSASSLSPQVVRRDLPPGCPRNAIDGCGRHLATPPSQEAAG